MSEAKKGKHTGWHHSLETRNKLSQSNSGEKSVNWKGGISLINRRIRNGLEIRLWRTAVFERDDFTCQKYGTRGGKLVAHHINNFSERKDLRFAIDNGITLSEEAHIKFHKNYGFRNNTKEQLQDYLKH